MAQRMGLPLAPSLLQSALATRLPVRRSFCEGGWPVLHERAFLENGPQGPWLQGTVAGQTRRLFTMQQVTVRVPGSTSNLGPGFDCLGVALRIHNSVTIMRGESRESSSVRLVSQAADRFFKQARRRPFPFSCFITEQVPRSRGLGSSATVRLGILFALNRLNCDPLDRLTVFRLCAELEGHPDNAAPATFGGFTVVGSARCTAPTVQRFEVLPRLWFVLLIPEVEIQTSRARQILPAKISRIAAAENSANACALTAAFASQDYKKLRGTFIDHLHQPFRSKLIPFLPRVIAAAENAGALGAFLSGSGSTIAAVTLRGPKKIAAAMTRAAAVPARIVITRADNRGAQTLSHRSPVTDHRSLFLHGPPA